VVNRSRENRNLGHNLKEPDDEWEFFYQEFDIRYPGTPVEHTWPKKFQRFLPIGQGETQVTHESQAVNNGRFRHQNARVCVEVEQSLFHDSVDTSLEGEVEAEVPPKGLVSISLEELIQLSAAKRKSPRLADRRIQIPGKRLPKFLPPVWKPRKNKQQVGDYVNQKMASR
jgi:hypothetical protein